MATKPIPDGYHTVTPVLIVEGAQKLVDFLQQAFSAEVSFCMKGQGETIAHAEVAIGDSIIMLSDATSQWKARSSAIYLYVEDIDAVYKRALEAGAPQLGSLQISSTGIAAQEYRIHSETTGGSRRTSKMSHPKSWRDARRLTQRSAPPTN